MKTITCLLALVFTATTAFAGDAKVVEASGKVDVELSYYGSKPKDCESDESGFCTSVAFVTLGLGLLAAKAVYREGAYKSATVTADSDIFIAPWGEGKAKIGLTLSKQKGCAPVQVNFTGVEMASGSFELYSPKDDVNSVGEVIVLEKKVMFHLNKGLVAKTSGKKGNTCSWLVEPDTNVELARAK